MADKKQYNLIMIIPITLSAGHIDTLTIKWVQGVIQLMRSLTAHKIIRLLDV